MIVIEPDPSKPKICYIDGKPYITDETQKTGDLCTFMYFDADLFFRYRESGLIALEIDKVKLEVAHRTAGRIARMYADERKYQITNEPVKHITVIPHGSGLSDFGKGIVVYQTIRSILLDPFSAEIGDYSYSSSLPYASTFGTRAVLNKKKNEIYYFADAIAMGHAIVQRVASMHGGATVQPGDVEIEETKLVIEPNAIEIKG